MIYSRTKNLQVVKKYKAKYWEGAEMPQPKIKEGVVGTEEEIPEQDDENEVKTVGSAGLEKKLTNSMIENPIIASNEISQHVERILKRIPN